MADCSCSAHGSFLTAKGLEEAAQRFSLEGLDSRDGIREVDRVVSVRAVDRDRDPIWDDDLIDSQHRRFLNEVRSGA